MGINKEEIVYKLLIDQNIKPKEPVRGKPLHITLKITNIGDMKFPGGKLVKLVLNYSDGRSYTDLAESVLPNIPEIEPNDSFETTSFTFIPLLEGLTWVNAQLQANDGQEVRHFQNPKADMVSNGVIGRRKCHVW